MMSKRVHDPLVGALEKGGCHIGHKAKMLYILSLCFLLADKKDKILYPDCIVFEGFIKEI